MAAKRILLALISGLGLWALGGLATGQEITARQEVATPRATDGEQLSDDQSFTSAQPLRANEIRYVQVPQADVFSGPSEDYYPTSRLNLGDAVEVFQRTSDGWLAIRPPKGSFSWLPASQGLLLPGGRIVEVTDATSVSWIGSALGTAKQYRWQVRLSRGEQLAVIGEQTMSNGESDQKTLWYKIAPPNGEFRWIREHDTTLDAQAVGDDTGNRVADGVAGSAPAPTSGRPTLHSVLAASFEEETTQEHDPQAATAAENNRRRAAGQRAATQESSEATKGNDPWATWHAIDYSNGSFSFPGIARLFGIEPVTAAGPANSYDPFDLTSSMPRPKRQAAVESAEAASSSATAGEPQETTAGTGELAHHKFRGWRDPRKLREMREGGTREHEGLGEAPLEQSVVNAGGSAAAAAWAGDLSGAVGTGVLQAGATTTGTGTAVTTSSNTAGAGLGNDDPNWYGIRQAPPAGIYTPLALSQADLGEIQLRLSEMVSGPQHTWDLRPLAERTRYLIDHGASAIERGEARLLMDRIEAFADLARRSAELGVAPPVSSPAQLQAGQLQAGQSQPGQSLAGAGAAAGGSMIDAAARWASPLGIGSPATETASGAAPRFDATGWVVPVHTTSRDMPTHALTNDAGKIIVYLSPAAGVNLARYQGQAVGVYGLRGYLPQLKTNHIQVQRVVRLQ